MNIDKEDYENLRIALKKEDQLKKLSNMSKMMDQIVDSVSETKCEEELSELSELINLQKNLYQTSSNVYDIIQKNIIEEKIVDKNIEELQNAVKCFSDFSSKRRMGKG